MITADDVDTLLFDVLGTGVDEAGSMRAELAAALDQADAGRQAEVLAALCRQGSREGSRQKVHDVLDLGRMSGTIRELTGGRKFSGASRR